MLYFSTVPQNGGMAEWTKATVLKTVLVQANGGSNPSSSALITALAELANPEKSGFVDDNWGDARVDDWGRLLSG